MPKGVKRTHEEFSRELEKITKTIQPIEQYQKNDVSIRFRCLKCSYEWLTTPKKILNGRGIE